MKVRLLAVMAVVVVGVMAGTSPAMASQWSHQHADNKQFGDAIHSLRIRTDLTNYTVGQITAASIEALTALKSGLTTIAGYTTDFKYGVVQVAYGTGGLGDGIAGVGPVGFVATPNIQPTGEQSTVTFPIRQQSGVTLALRLFTAVRSANPDKGTVRCHVSVAGGAIASGNAADLGGPANTRIDKDPNGYFVTMPQSRLTPQNGSKAFPYSLVATEDNVLNLADPDLLSGKAPINVASGGFGVGTLSCFVS